MPFTDLRIPNASADAVAVFDEDFKQCFELARPIKAAIGRSKDIMSHPIETGAEISDHAVFKPIEIELSLILSSAEFRSTYAQIERYFLGNNLLTVQTKASTYRDMVIKDMPHDEDPETFDVIVLALSLKEADFVTAQLGTLPASKVKNAADSSTVDKGQVQSRDTGSSPQAGSIIHGWFN